MEPVTTVDLTQRTISGVRLGVLSTGYAVMIEKPDEFNDTVMQFPAESGSP